MMDKKQKYFEKPRAVPWIEFTYVTVNGLLSEGEK